MLWGPTSRTTDDTNDLCTDSAHFSTQRTAAYNFSGNTTGQSACDSAFASGRLGTSNQARLLPAGSLLQAGADCQ
jgi:hypothetical protein